MTSEELSKMCGKIREEIIRLELEKVSINDRIFDLNRAGDLLRARHMTKLALESAIRVANSIPDTVEPKSADASLPPMPELRYRRSAV